MIKKMNKQEIVNIINLAFEATEESKAGKINTIKDNMLILNYVGFNTFMAVLNSLLPHTVEGKTEISEPEEPWKR